MEASAMILSSWFGGLRLTEATLKLDATS